MVQGCVCSPSAILIRWVADATRPLSISPPARVNIKEDVGKMVFKVKVICNDG